MLNLLKTFRCDVRRRGSALLIVLGFLSFMIISGVSFAIYMRIERQASSNYRHAVNARHLLNAALARAMEEVDAELRLKSNQSLKFPDWPGRVLASAIPDEDDDVQTGSDARVLSLEALSFLPPFLVNDVRRYAVRQENDQPYEGAKWRKLEGEVNGRYAYVCVNVSDMLDVNKCRAQYRDATTNRVSLGHLFDSEALRTKFDTDAQKDLRYFSLQDFYSARYEREKTDISSPFHNYVKNGNFQPFEDPELLKQAFITDSIAKPEPVHQDACNIWLNPPIAPALLSKRTPDPADLAGAVDDVFWEAFTHSDLFPGTDEQVMAALLKDYIDVDNVPSLLNAPCLEMVPMISQIVIPDNILKYSVDSRIEAGAGGNPDVTVYTLHLLDDSTLEFPIEVEVVWPFKNAQHRNLSPSYSLEVEAFLVVDKNGNERSTTGFQSRGEWIPLDVTLSGSIPPVWNSLIRTENDCFKKIDVNLKADRGDVTFEVFRDAAPQNGFVHGKFRVSLCMFARIKEGNVWVDSVPHNPPVNPLPDDEKGDNTKLYFQTAEILLAPGTIVPTPYTWDWTNLEVADPRFNHNASNWVKNDTETFGAAAGVNKSTKDILDSLDGGDRDLFMFVANTGKLQSPGELGFIIRPHQFRNSDDPSRKFGDASEAEPREIENMFRTIRLYDHGGNGVNQLRDEVCKYFYAMRPDGTLPGARVNPLSDMPEVLEAALWDTPLDYWIASDLSGLSPDDRSKLTVTRHANYFNVTSLPDNWVNFRDKWAEAMVKVLDPKENPNNPNKVWSRTVADYYGDQKYFKWYSEDPTKIFENGLPNGLELHEIDRKMLYSFSLDSFSDRQQLFLYFIRAEVTMPAFGGGSGMQSLAGGRAVALVWRDPYPRGFVKDNDNDNNNDQMDKDGDWYPDSRNTDYESPWKQYPGRGTGSRHAGHHDTRVLFFKQLGQ
jgi:hypothetical protein